MNPLKAERAKPSLSSDYNLLFKNKIGESSLDIHRFLQFAARLPIEVNQIADGVEPSVTGRMHGAK